MPATRSRKLFGDFSATPGDALTVVEAGDLPSRSALRRAFEAASAGAAIGCYPDTPRDLAAVIRETLAAHQVTASRDAGQFLVEHLGSDRRLTRSELEKLALYAGDGGRIELDDARLSISDSAALELDDAVMAAAEGDAPKLERVLGRVFQEGESPVSVIRALLRHLHRLHVLASRLASGTRHRRSAAFGAPADLLQAGRQFSPSARAMDRSPATRGARACREGRTRHQDNRVPGRRRSAARRCSQLAQAARPLRQ